MPEIKQRSKCGRFVLQLLFSFCLLVPVVAVAAKESGPLKDLGQGIYLQQKNGKMWQMERSRKLKSATGVEEYISKLNKGEYSDWRLPTKYELYELISMFDLQKNASTNLRLDVRYWLIDDKGEMSVGAWEVGDQCGPSRTFYPGKSGYVRAVRP